MLYSSNLEQKKDKWLWSYSGNIKKEKIYCKCTHRYFKVEFIHDTTCSYNKGILSFQEYVPESTIVTEIYTCILYLAILMNCCQLGVSWEGDQKLFLSPVQIHLLLSFQCLLNWFIIHQYSFKIVTGLRSNMLFFFSYGTFSFSKASSDFSPLVLSLNSHLTTLRKQRPLVIILHCISIQIYECANLHTHIFSLKW